MPRRLVITFNNLVAARSSQVQQITPDGQIVSVQTLPTDPSICMTNTHASVGRMLLQRNGQTGYEYERDVIQLFKKYPEFVQGYKQLMNNQKIDEETLMKMYSFKDKSLSFFQLLQELLFTARQPFVFVQCYYGVDLLRPTLRDYQKHTNFVKFCSSQ